MEPITVDNSVFLFDEKGGMCTGWFFKNNAILYPLGVQEDGKSRGGIFTCFPFFGPPPKGMESIG